SAFEPWAKFDRGPVSVSVSAAVLRIPTDQTMSRAVFNRVRYQALALTEAERAVLAYDLVASLARTARGEVVTGLDTATSRLLEKDASGAATIAEQEELSRGLRQRLYALVISTMEGQIAARSLRISREALLRCLYHLEILVPSLDRVGSCGHDLPKEVHNQITSDFVHEWSVGVRLAEIRRLLSLLLPYDELERLFGELPVWRFGSRKPPEGI